MYKVAITFLICLSLGCLSRRVATGVPGRATGTWNGPLCKLSIVDDQGVTIQNVTGLIVENFDIDRHENRSNVLLPAKGATVALLDYNSRPIPFPDGILAPRVSVKATFDPNTPIPGNVSKPTSSRSKVTFVLAGVLLIDEREKAALLVSATEKRDMATR